MHIESTLRRLAHTRAEKVGLTRFFRNRSVSVAEILKTAAGRTAQAAAGRHVLVIQDTSEINYQAKAQRKRGLGRVGNGTDAGLFVHPALAVDADDGSVLGLAAATIWRRDKVKDEDYQARPIEAKESHRWLATPAAARQACIGHAAMITVVSDRESDIYELFARLPEAHTQGPSTQGPPTHVLVRASKDRALAQKGQRLFATIAAASEAGRLSFDLAARPGRCARTVTLSVRFCRVALRQPRVGADRRDPRVVSLNMVEVREIEPPAGEQPVVWRLLTTHAVDSVEDAARIVDLYRLRWTIEQLFRTVKSQGLALEESFLADGDALECLAATALVAACMVMQLVQGRGEAGRGIAASRVFGPAEIRTMTKLIPTLEGKTEKQKNPHPKRSLAWAAWCIARLGGWTGYAKERPPGPITMSRGLRRFASIVHGFSLATRSEYS